MQYNQSMTNLVFAIRARLSAAHKQTIKTSNPELLGDLAEIYQATLDIKLRAEIEELMSLAGPTWSALLQKPALTQSVVRLHKTPPSASNPAVMRVAVA